MGITDKLANAKKTNWVSEGISEAEVKTTVELAKISAKVERSRIDLGMTQKEFADFMGVSQGMVSKWESRQYNFTIRSLNEIFEKINLTLSLSMDSPCPKNDYVIIKWDAERSTRKRKKNEWISHINNKGAIA